MRAEGKSRKEKGQCVIGMERVAALRKRLKKRNETLEEKR